MLFIASVKTSRKAPIEIIRAEYKYKKDFYKDLRSNGYRVQFITTEENFENDCEKFYAKLEDRKLLYKYVQKAKKEDKEEVKKEVKEEPKKETEKQYLVKSENGFELTTNDLQEAKKTIYNETCRNINDTFAIIELNPDGSWKKVLIECKLTNREQANKLADFVANNVEKQRQLRQI